MTLYVKHYFPLYTQNHAATVLYDMNFQILDFYLRGQDEVSRDGARKKFQMSGGTLLPPAFMHINL